MKDNVDHISAKTRERAITLAESAKKMGLHPGNLRFNSTRDFMAFWFTDGSKYVIIFCHPDGYMAEIHTEEKGEMIANYTLIKNIRNFLFSIRRQKLVSFDQYHDELAELADMDDADVKDIVQQFLDNEEDKDD